MAIADLMDDNGTQTAPDRLDPRYRDFPLPSGPAVPVPSSGYDLDSFYQRTLGRAPDANERASDMENIGKYGAGAFESDFLSKRPNNQPGSGTYAQVAPQSVPSGPSPSKQFSDPISSFLEDWSNKYAKQLENPPQGSGRSMLENALQQIAGQFQKGGFTPAEQEVFQTQALDPLEQLRKARKQQVMEELSRRGISPTSGVALSMLQDVDRQFDASRAQTQRGIAAQGAQETQQRMLQAVNLLSTLAGSQDQRMNQAFNYYSVPYNLSNNAFNQSMQFAQMNNPLSLIQPLLSLSAQQQGRQDNQGAALADLIWALTQMGR